MEWGRMENVGWSRPVPMDVWASLCSSVVALMVSLIALLCSLLVVFSCDFEYSTLDVEGPRGDSRRFMLSLGIFRYAANEEGSVDGKVGFFQSASCQGYGEDANDGHLRGAQVLAILAPVFATIGCVFCCLGLYWPVKRWFQWGMMLAWLEAWLFQMGAHATFLGKDFCSSENGYGECEGGVGMVLSIVAIVAYFLSVVGSFVTIRYRELARFGERRRRRKQELSQTEYPAAEYKSVDMAENMPFIVEEEMSVVERTFEMSYDASVRSQSWEGRSSSVEEWGGIPSGSDLETSFDSSLGTQAVIFLDESDQQPPTNKLFADDILPHSDQPETESSVDARRIELFDNDAMATMDKNQPSRAPLEIEDVTPRTSELEGDECRSCPDADPDFKWMRERSFSV